MQFFQRVNLCRIQMFAEKPKDWKNLEKFWKMTNSVYGREYNVEKLWKMSVAMVDS